MCLSYSTYILSVLATYLYHLRALLLGPRPSIMSMLVSMASVITKNLYNLFNWLLLFHFTRVVLYALRDGHTRILTSQIKAISRNQYGSGLKNYHYYGIIVTTQNHTTTQRANGKITKCCDSSDTGDVRT